MALTARFDDREYGPQVFRPLRTSRRAFLRVWPWLEKAANLNGPTNTRDGVWARIADGECQLWTAPEAAVVTTIQNYRDTGLREVRCWLAGGELDDARKLERDIAEWARECGCSRLLIAGRRGWLRGLEGYRELNTTIAKDL